MKTLYYKSENLEIRHDEDCVKYEIVNGDDVVELYNSNHDVSNYIEPLLFEEYKKDEEQFKNNFNEDNSFMVEIYVTLFNEWLEEKEQKIKK